MLQGYVPVLILFLVALALTVIMVVLALIAGPKKPNETKLSPVEGGLPPVQPTPQRFPVKFLEVAMIFLIFDIETVAIFPWAVLLNQLKVFGLVEMGLFLLVLGIGYIYLWRKGAFNWEKE
ncbi:MAG TPA: NADH-quinone oxidoreductase subunit A [Chloroflexia bacterium]|nr:NADH-quinone oxidoreductase subunit A [Chloroflexia bacterium]